jgi:hypothetical protein
MSDPADRALARSLVETHWRDMIDASFRGDMEKATAIQQRLDERILEIMVELPTDRGSEFVGAAEEERNKLFEEYRRDPEALKRRIGAATAVPMVRPSRQPSRPSAAMVIGDTVVRTAVRATVWESVRAIFRGFGV